MTWKMEDSYPAGFLLAPLDTVTSVSCQGRDAGGPAGFSRSISLNLYEVARLFKVLIVDTKGVSKKSIASCEGWQPGAQASRKAWKR